MYDQCFSDSNASSSKYHSKTTYTISGIIRFMNILLYYLLFLTADGSPVGNDSDVGVIASILPPEQSPTRRYTPIIDSKSSPRPEGTPLS